MENVDWSGFEFEYSVDANVWPIRHYKVIGQRHEIKKHNMVWWEAICIDDVPVPLTIEIPESKLIKFKNDGS